MKFSYVRGASRKTSTNEIIDFWVGMRMIRIAPIFAVVFQIITHVV